jgi:hypothetical protein
MEVILAGVGAGCLDLKNKRWKRGGEEGAEGEVLERVVKKGAAQHSLIDTRGSCFYLYCSQTHSLRAPSRLRSDDVDGHFCGVAV